MERLCLLIPYSVLFLEKAYERIVLRFFPELRKRFSRLSWNFLLPVLMLTIPMLSEASVFKGDASQASGLIYLTDGSSVSKGAVFSSSQLNLRSGFDMSFDVKITASSGSEGFCFVLTKRNTVSIGANGGGIAYKGMDTSLGIEFDTHNNGSFFNDNNSDHIAVRKNGAFTSGANLSGTFNTTNLEDNTWHTIRIKYTSSSTKLEVWIDGVREINLTNNIRTNVFQGDSMVYWGLTGSNSSGSTRTIINNLTQPLPVKLLTFEAETAGNHNILNWSTASEYNAEKFEIYRSADGNSWELLGSVPCVGNSNIAVQYNYVDESVNGAKVFYMLRQIDFDGNDEYFSAIMVKGSKPTAELRQKFYDENGSCVFYGTLAEFLQISEPGKLYISEDRKKYTKK